MSNALVGARCDLLRILTNSELYVTRGPVAESLLATGVSNAIGTGRLGKHAMKQTIQYCTTADGAKLAYAIDGEGPPLVLATSWLTHLGPQWRALAWQPWLDTFSNDYTLLRYDARGSGLSDRDPAELSAETWVRDLEAV